MGLPHIPQGPPIARHLALTLSLAVPFDLRGFLAMGWLLSAGPSPGTVPAAVRCSRRCPAALEVCWTEGGVAAPYATGTRAEGKDVRRRVEKGGRPDGIHQAAAYNVAHIGRGLSGVFAT